MAISLLKRYLNVIASFAILFGTILWSLTQSCSISATNDIISFSSICFSIILFNSIGNYYKFVRKCKRQKTRNQEIFKLFNIFELLTLVYIIPLVCAEMYLYSNFKPYVAFMHLLYPLSIFINKKDVRNNVDQIYILNIVSIISLLYVSTINLNFLGIVSAILYMQYICLYTRVYGCVGQSTHNYVMTFFIIVTVRALRCLGTW